MIYFNPKFLNIYFARGTKAKMLCPAMRKSLKINVNVI
jgi:hypothetical protein